MGDQIGQGAPGQKISETSDDRDPYATATVRSRYKMTLAYDGTLFHGWQKQFEAQSKLQNTTPDDIPTAERQPLRTVAGVVEETLQRVLKQPITLVGASRTDAGVHALGQVAHFDAQTSVPIDRLAAAINSRLPDDVEAVRVQTASPNFDAISDVKSKQYRYRVFNTQRRPLGHRHLVWHCWSELDVSAMADAGRRLVGTHDFAGFAAADHNRATTVRTVLNCDVTQAEHSPEVHIVVSGTGFLYNMVRIIAGTLIEVGRGRFEPTVVDRVLETGNRQLAGPTLPAQALCLEWIKY